ncbi:MAG: hypothetical protein ABL962_10560, partial [Fimbriimonadaceae bacterium]
LQVTKNPDDPLQQEYVLSAPKMSHGPKPKGRIFRIETVEVSEMGISCSVGKVKWIGTSDLTPDELVAKSELQSSSSELAKAMKFVADELSTGPVLSSDVFKEAAAKGFSEKTVKLASIELSVQKVKQKGVEHGPWVWSLPGQIGSSNK